MVVSVHSVFQFLHMFYQDRQGIPDRIREARPDYLLILPWNFKDEIIAQMAHIREWGGRFVVPIPEVAVYP